MKSERQISFWSRVEFALSFGALIGLLLSGCNRTRSTDADNPEKERLDLALREGTEAYAKATLARGEQPQSAVSVRQLLEWGFLKETDTRGLKSKDLLVAVAVEPVEEFRLTTNDIEQLFVGDGSSKVPVSQDGGHDVCLKLTTSRSDALREMTSRIIGRKLRVSVGDVTIMEARVASEVPGPWVILSMPSNTQAKEIVVRLNKSMRQTKGSD